ncbi:MAG: acetolactate synthase large subunit, partial [Candidatus Lokiarchaeota archaeon]|nr:acetolactate synthase large subunit [Candidatus Lokiarchaeota archaeon]
LYQWRYCDTDRPRTDFAPIASGFGAKAYSVSDLSDLDNTIEAAINTKGFKVIDVKIDEKELLPKNYY